MKDDCIPKVISYLSGLSFSTVNMGDRGKSAGDVELLEERVSEIETVVGTSPSGISQEETLHRMLRDAKKKVDCVFPNDTSVLERRLQTVRSLCGKPIPGDEGQKGMDVGSMILAQGELVLSRSYQIEEASPLLRDLEALHTQVSAPDMEAFRKEQDMLERLKSKDKELQKEVKEQSERIDKLLIKYNTCISAANFKIRQAQERMVNLQNESQ